MLESVLTFLKGLWPALIAAAVSIITVVYTQYKSKRLAFFQTFFIKKMDVYSEFWASIGHYERDKSVENYARLQAALHTVCLFAPLRIYENTLVATNELHDCAHLSGKTTQELLDMMRLDLDQCRRLKFSAINPADPKISIKDPNNRK